jgi:DNA-binding response OmpR family regulator
LAGIMIVDDEPTIQQLLKIIIEDMGHTVIAQSLNGDSALKLYRSMDTKPDVVIIDHRMPIMSGLELVTNILKEKADQRVLFLTADDTVKDRVKELGITAFLEKPAEIEVIRSTIRSLIAGKVT